MTCAKKKVICRIIAADGSVFTGENACNAPQTVCPRAPGEDFTKCKTICEQPGHAEIMALRKAGKKAEGAIAEIEGIGYFCKECQVELFRAGVIALRLKHD